MQGHLYMLYDDALKLLRQLSTPKGILASTIESDNYKRLWARDSIICGIAGILANDAIVIKGLKTSLLSLAANQHPLGMMPSNVFKDGKNTDVSYGSLAGRVDTNTWFIVGACIYYLNTKDEKIWQTLLPAIKKSRAYLSTIEFNNKGWIYTPLSGNWADEYPIHGYTLYDNWLRIWGESLWEQIHGKTTTTLENLKEKTSINFWPQDSANSKKIFQQQPFSNTLNETISHFCAFILPGKYDMRFDAAGNALALLNYKLSKEQKLALSQFLETMKQHLSKKLVPAFWPVIKADSQDWELLKHNYSYNFKNKSYHFHNGGIWPVWMGLFCLGLSFNGMQNQTEHIIEDFINTVTVNDAWDFNEYLVADTLQLGGKAQMGFTASGIIFMHYALHDNSFKTKLGL